MLHLMHTVKDKHEDFVKEGRAKNDRKFDNVAMDLESRSRSLNWIGCIIAKILCHFILRLRLFFGARSRIFSSGRVFSLFEDVSRDGKIFFGWSALCGYLSFCSSPVSCEATCVLTDSSAAAVQVNVAVASSDAIRCESGYFANGSRQHLFYQRFLPPAQEPLRYLVFYAHGLHACLESTSVQRLISAFVKPRSGIGFVAMEHHNHGRSVDEAAGGLRGFFSDWHILRDDFVAFIRSELLLPQHRNVPFVVAGHSMGGTSSCFVRA